MGVHPNLCTRADSFNNPKMTGQYGRSADKQEPGKPRMETSANRGYYHDEGAIQATNCGPGLYE